jgi:hypothetical protein
MSTTPFMLIEGPIALPPLRPLGDLSRSFGREWSLLPPNISFRVELKALYAAVLRTFCLSSQAIRTMCKWEPRRTPPVGAAAAPAVAPGSEAHPATSLRVPPLSAGSPHAQRQLLAGGACALGGAAMLTWIVVHFTPPRDTTQSPFYEDLAEASVAVPASTPHPSQPADSSAATAAMPGASPVSAAPRVTQSDFSVRPLARAVAPAAIAPLDTVPIRELAQTAAEPPAGVAVRTVAAALAQSAPVVVHTAPVPSRPLYKPSASARQVAARASTAGPYTRRTLPATSADDYASLVTFARTLGSEFAPVRRVDVHIDVSSTEWTEHMSQRRITEVPELFAK